MCFSLKMAQNKKLANYTIYVHCSSLDIKNPANGCDAMPSVYFEISESFLNFKIPLHDTWIQNTTKSAILLMANV